MLPERGKRCHSTTEICIAFGNNQFQFIGLQCISDKRRNDCKGQINVAEITPRGNLLRTERRQLFGDIQLVGARPVSNTCSNDCGVPPPGY